MQLQLYIFQTIFKIVRCSYCQHYSSSTASSTAVATAKPTTAVLLTSHSFINSILQCYFREYWIEKFEQLMVILLMFIFHNYTECGMTKSLLES